MKNKFLLYLILGLLVISSTVLGILLVKVDKERDLLASKLNESFDFEFKPIVVSKSETINVGEEYIANIYLACVDISRPPTVHICDSLENEDYSINSLNKVLEYNDEYQTFIYRNTPRVAGEYVWWGVIINDYQGRSDSLFFSVEYQVK